MKKSMRLVCGRYLFVRFVASSANELCFVFEFLSQTARPTDLIEIISDLSEEETKELAVLLAENDGQAQDPEFQQKTAREFKEKAAFKLRKIVEEKQVIAYPILTRAVM